MSWNPFSKTQTPINQTQTPQRGFLQKMGNKVKSMGTHVSEAIKGYNKNYYNGIEAFPHEMSYMNNYNGYKQKTKTVPRYSFKYRNINPAFPKYRNGK